MRRLIIILSTILICLTTATACNIVPGGERQATPTVQDPFVVHTLISLKNLDFDSFIDDSYTLLLKRDPEAVSELGLDSQLGMSGDQLTDLSPEYIATTQQMESGVFALLQGYDRAALTPEQQITYDIYYWYLADLVKGHEFTYNDYPINVIVWSIDQSLIQFFTDQIPVTTKEEAEKYVARLTLVKAKFDQLLDGLKIREEKGVIIPSMFISWVLPSIHDVAFAKATATVFYTSFASKSKEIASLSSGDKQHLLRQAEEAINSSVIPAFQELAEYLTALRRVAPSAIGIGSTPDGQETYAYRLRHETNTDLTTEEVHQMGLDAFDETHARMREIFDELGYPKNESLVDLYKRVANDGGVLSDQAIYDEYVRLIDFAKETSKNLFNIMPEADVIVVPVPSGGYYVPPSYDGRRPGMFYATDTGTMPRYDMPDVTFHESIPGHHYQFGIIPQLHLPLFQDVVVFDGYSEGWALYAERLMWENGAYENDPYGELGYLQLQAVRAARLVVDTGVNSMGWNFDQAVQWMMENTGLDEGSCQFEVARAAMVPGQSSSYFVGYQVILGLRQEMQDALGSKFDIKAFHDLILENGPVPLTLLQTLAEQKIQEIQK
jgi:uncharacterized protein (DUF885 family)